MRRLSLILVIVLGLAPRLRAEPLTPMAAGDDRDVWIVLPAPTPTAAAAIAVFHRRESDAGSGVARVATLSGRLAPGGVAAGAGRLWLVYDNFSVQTLCVVFNPDLGVAHYSEPRMEPSLPKAAALVGFAADDRGPWALVRIEDRATLEAVDRAAPPATEESEDQPPSSAAPASEPATESAPAAEQAVHAQRLLRLERGKWVKVELPLDWPADARAWVVTPRPDADYPVLAAALEGGEIRVYEREGVNWVSRPHKLETTGRLVMIAVDGQVVAGRQMEEDNALGVGLTLLRHDADSVIPRMRLSGTAGGGWSLFRVGQTAALVALSKDGKMSWMRQTLRGTAIVPPALLGERPAGALFENPGPSLVTGLMVASMLVLFLVWRRDAAAKPIVLPEGYVSADMLRRFVAGLIDLAPGVALAAVTWEVPLRDAASLWYAAGPNWDAMVPVLAAVGVCTGHCFVAELFTARSLGKWLMGLKVVSVDSAPLNVWQVAGRNVLKALELVFWPVLMLLPIIRPHGQRLGDMVARTVVVMEKPGDDEGGDKHDEP